MFDSAMILLHNIIQVLAGSYSNAMRHRSRGLQFGDGPMRSPVSIQRDDTWSRVTLHRFIALWKKRLAAVTSRRSLSRKSSARPCMSTARYRYVQRPFTFYIDGMRCQVF